MSKHEPRKDCNYHLRWQSRSYRPVFEPATPFSHEAYGDPTQVARGGSRTWNSGAEIHSNYWPNCRWVHQASCARTIWMVSKRTWHWMRPLAHGCRAETKPQGYPFLLFHYVHYAYRFFEGFNGTLHGRDGWSLAPLMAVAIEWECWVSRGSRPCGGDHQGT